MKEETYSLMDNIKHYAQVLGVVTAFSGILVGTALLSDYLDNVKEKKYVMCDNWINAFKQGVIVKTYEDRTEVITKNQSHLSVTLVDLGSDGELDYKEVGQLGPRIVAGWFKDKPSLEDKALYSQIQ